MIIEKVYNNNVIQVRDDSDQELIVMGRGLGFQKKIGDAIDQRKIEKTFTFQNQQTSADLSDLYEQLPDEELNLFISLIDQAEQSLGLTFDENLHLSLTDHLHFMVVRVRQGVSISNPLAWEVRKFYAQEYQVAKEMLVHLRKKLALDIPDDEAASIALHLINAQTETDGISKSQRTTRLVIDILEIVRLHFGKLVSEDSISYNRFVTHLQYFSQRVVNGVVQGSNDAFLYDQVKQNYPNSFICTQKIAHYVKENYDFDMSVDEKVYLTIHIQRMKVSLYKPSSQ
ncbi:BglG family transcription antiterminator LicT [Streptococcus dysgalactiae]|uniref:BglG family transcription antiterminator LicT n=1 Tax=Streptococcus dysgalactiae TaxID=1334 RepID=UPI000313E93F|nr:PRD domain-containing protein [Streptococcus dysgalactiae]